MPLSIDGVAFNSNYTPIVIEIVGAVLPLGPTNPTELTAAGFTVGTATISGNQITLPVTGASAGFTTSLSYTPGNLVDSSVVPQTLIAMVNVEVEQYGGADAGLSDTKVRRNGMLRFGIS